MAWLLETIVFTALYANVVLGAIVGEFTTSSAKNHATFRHPKIISKEDTIPRFYSIRPNAVPEFTRTVQVTPNMEATWTVYYEIGKIDFFVQTKTRGFVGFGITDDGRRADLIIGGIRDIERPYFADRYSATGNGSKIDAKQDWQLHEVMETSDSTLIWFIRSLNTGDTAEDIAITDKETNILWIIGETDDIEGPSSTGLLPINFQDPGIPKIDFERTVTLSPRLVLTWKVNFNIKTVTFDLTGNTTGYIGFGIGKTTSMNTDLIVGGVNSADLTPYFADCKGIQHSPSIRSINADPSQDYDLISAREVNGVTRLRFIRDFDTGDVNDYVIKYENAHFIWALGTNDALNQHPGGDSRGAFPVNPLLARI